jgi:phosphoglycolate phosphatase-like HAD superfamily hydrolase
MVEIVTLSGVAKYGISPERTYYIFDTTGDIVEAQAAGVRTVAVT